MDWISRRELALEIGGVALASLSACATAPANGDVRVTPEARMARAQSAIGRGTRYLRNRNPPSPLLDVWPAGIQADCSGLIAWIHGLTRRPDKFRDLGENASTLYTDTFYDDIVLAGRQRYFRRRREPSVGDIVVYPHWFDGTEEDAGHIAFITQVTSTTEYQIIDCSKTVFDEQGDTTPRERSGAVFNTHRAFIENARRDHPEHARTLQPPVFGRFID